MGTLRGALGSPAAEVDIRHQSPDRSGSGSVVAQKKQFRPEIEGTRFIAAFLVATYHLWSGRVSGGVDVFFVMSGFLITTTLMGHLDRFGRVRPLFYLSRLAVRLLPAAMVTLVSVLVATRLLLPTLRWEDVAQEIRASALYFQNWYLVENSTDYLARFAEKSPVQHFWALSLQGQFYVLWLVVFLVATVLVRRFPVTPERAVVPLLALVFVTSLAYSIWLTHENQPVAYFSTPARAWEFAVGGLAAYALLRPMVARSWLRWLAGWVGLLVLLTTGLVVQVSAAFPGYAALLPTSGAVLILVSARNEVRFGADRLLSHPLLVRLGGLSYGMYLWHFPLIVFWRSRTETETIGVGVGIGIIVASVGLSWATQRLVERPILSLRDRARGSGGRRIKDTARSRPRGALVPLGLVAVSLLTATVAARALTGQVDDRRAEVFLDLAEETTKRAYDLDPCFGAMVAVANPGVVCAPPTSLVGPPPELIKQTQQLLPCETEYRTDRVEICRGGSDDPSPRATVLFAGDSHSLTMRVGLELVAQRHGWRLLYAGGRDCQTATKQKPGRTHETCSGWIEDLTSYINAHGQVDVLFTMQAAGRLLEGSPAEDPSAYAAASFRDQWDRVEGAVGRVVVIRDNPRLFTSVVSCLARHGFPEGQDECSRPREVALTPDYSALAAERDEDPLTTVADITDVFCDQSTCYPVVGGVIAYVDDAHLHTVFTRTLAVALDEAIRDAVGPDVVRTLFDTA